MASSTPSLLFFRHATYVHRNLRNFFFVPFSFGLLFSFCSLLKIYLCLFPIQHTLYSTMFEISFITPVCFCFDILNNISVHPSPLLVSLKKNGLLWYLYACHLSIELKSKYRTANAIVFNADMSSIHFWRFVN